ncbi:zinc finger protein 592 isoform X2 [Pristis pectinata]|uniref:zinc finger protein 592 isoform X2 n=1 Tax=Pristis pectinata TaxID=685728 RepID=UPI00223DD1D6|nr:zinc finger protein 592 isoform X2 [Pristis pectinata]
MGDMKTPDFDDLLAAFDIPDPDLDAKEAIQSSSEESEGHLKQSGMGIDELSIHHTIPDVPVVSVIVKNTSRQESFESITEKDSHQLGQNLLQNGFRNADITSDSNNYNKMVTAFINGDSSRNYSSKFDTPRTEALPTFSQFSPISSPEPEEGMQDAGIVDNIKADKGPYLGSVGLYISTDSSLMNNTREHPEQVVTELSMFDEYSKKRDRANEIRNCKMKEVPLGQKANSTNTASQEAVQETKDFDKNSSLFDNLESSCDLHNNSLEEPKTCNVPESSLCSSVPPRQRLKSAHSKLTSCLAALVALNAKKTSEFPKEEHKENSKESLLSLKDGVRGSPKMAKSPKSPRSPMEGVKKMTNKQSDSPRSVSSDYSGKGSPYVATGSPPAIPKVRIKTIKTSSGEITRTVTRVMPDSEQSESRSSPEQSVTEMALTEDLSIRSSPVTSAPSQTHASLAMENVKKPLLTNNIANAVSSLNNISVKGTATQMFDENINGNSNLKAISISPESASSAIMKAAGVVQLQKQMGLKQSSNVPSTNLLPKAVHLASLNLVPHSVAATATARSTTLRQSQQKIATQVVTVPLVQQIKNVVPQNNESPTSAQSIVVEAFNKLLNGTNPVPIYAPNLKPPANSNVSMPARGYRCLECGDAFALEKSLSQHYERRSVHIEMMCSHCSKIIVFFNKCSLLLHAREHKGKGAVMQCSQLQMKPIPSDQMFSTTPVTSSVMSGTLAQDETSAVGPDDGNLTVIGMGSSAFGHPAMPLHCDSLRLIRHGLKCLECYQQFQDYASLAGHYQRVTDDAEAPTCRVCQMMLPNRCSYAAHLRIHTHKSPYCCPECGAVCRSAYFQTHVKENCLHYARTVAYRCMHCGGIFSDSNTIKTHIQVSHSESFHKCTICPMAFKSAQSANSHYSSQHPLVKHPPPEVIFKCSMCETVFNQQALLHKHFEQHKNKLRICVYKCPVCRLVYMHKQLMMEHFKDVHNIAETAEKPPSSGSPSRGTSCGQTAEASAAPIAANGLNDGKKDEATMQKSDRRPKVKKLGWTCGECLQWFPERELYVSHMKRSHGKSMKRYPCRQCDRSFNSSHSLRRHVRVNHDGVKRTYTCWYCTDEKHFFAKRFMLEKHINLMHGIRNPDFSQMPKAVHTNSDAKVDLPGKRMASDSEAAEQPSSNIIASLPKKLKVAVFKQYRCSKCGYMTKSKADFQEHIPQHKTDGSTFQCSQCGLCYTSALSLNRHLYIVHKFKEPEKLQADVVSENGQDEHNGESNTTSEEDVDHQCQVCKDVFDNETALSAHVRTHGMRFILSKQNGGSEQ